MFEPARVKHSVVAVLSDGTQVDVTDACERTGLEENKGEYAQRANLTLRNVTHNGKRLVSILPLCSRFYVFARYTEPSGTITRKELFRGGNWKVSGSLLSDEAFTVTAYDDLMYLIKSKESRFYAQGTTTDTILKGIFAEYGIPLGRYNGPVVSHDKLVFKSKTIAASIKEALDDAKKKGAPECFPRMTEGRVDVIPYGFNDTVYVFDDKNTASGQYSESMLNLVTKVNVMGKADDDGKSAIEATVRGNTQYGIIIDIVDRNDETLAHAQSAAQDIIDEKGEPEKTKTFTAVNVPFVRKGDIAYMNVGPTLGYAKVLGVSHDIRAGTMQMEVEMV